MTYADFALMLVVTFAVVVLNFLRNVKLRKLENIIVDLKDRLIDLEDAVFEDDDPPDPGEEQPVLKGPNL